MKKISFILLVILFFLAILDACSSSRISHSWKKEVLIHSFNHIVVIAIVRQDNHALRSNMETHLVSDLRASGIDAVSVMELSGPKALEGKTESEVLDKIKQPNTDGILTIVLLNKKKEKYYVPGRVYYSPYAVYHRYFWGYYNAVYDRIYEPGYYSVKTEYFWESNLYDAKTNELVYSVQTTSFDPASTDRLAHEYGKLITEDLKSNSIIR